MKILLKIFVVMTFIVIALNSADFLMPEEAFKPYASSNEKMQIEAGIELGNDIYVYADKVNITLKDSYGISIKEIESPESVDHQDEKVYIQSPNFIVTLQNDAALSGNKDITLLLAYQGCSELGLCYEPSIKEFTISVNTSLLGIQGVKTSEKVSNVEKSETQSIAETIKSKSLIIILVTFFGFGLLLAMTPCVFPMIPIISGLIISQGKGLTTKKAFALSLVYVLSMAIAYTIAGVLAGLFGANLQAALQTPWVIYSFSFIFVALAFSMFGFYELKLPDFIVNKVSSSSNRSGFVGVAIMGFLSALIVGPCVAAPLAGALVYIGQTGDAVLGGLALFFMSIGMGVPLIVVGVSAGKFMPRPGEWMTMVTAIFGVMMLGVAIWMLEKIVDPSITMVLYSILGIGFSLFLGVFETTSHFFKRGVAMVIFIYSVALFLGFLAGSSSMTKPLGFLKQEVIASTIQQKSKNLEFQVIKSIDELNVVLENNKGKKILVDFAADWCTACKELEEITFADTKVQAKMSEFVLVRADVTSNSKENKDLSKKYGVFGPPSILFFNEKSEQTDSKSIIGFIEPEKFLQHLEGL